VCQVRKLADESTQRELTRRYGWIEIQGLQVGDCKMQVVYPQANEGEGLTVELSVPVQNL
jgi:hypothetical protein